MKFYKRFPGDIQIKTGGLTLAEFGAYDRLLDHYYAMEAPIEPGEVYSITRALTKTDREAVDKVLRRYFSVDANGNYTQERADEMIAEAQPKIEAARQNGLKGGRPKKNQDTAKPKPTGLFSGTEEEPNSKTSQSQSTSSSPSVQKKARKRAGLPCPEGVDAQVWSDWLELREARRAPVTDTVLKGAVSEAAKAGMTLEAFLRVWCTRGTQGLQADWLKPHERGGPVIVSEPAWRTEQRERAAQFAGPAAARKSTELETVHAVPALVG